MSFEQAVENGAKVKTISGPNKVYNVGSDEYRRKTVYKGRVFLSEVKKRKSSALSKQRIQRQFDIGLRREL